MRRIISLLLTAMMLLSLFAVGFFSTSVSAASSANDFGSVAAGYTPKGTPITSEKEFLEMEEDGDYYLANDITINSTYGLAYDKSGKVMFNNYGEPLVEYLFSGTFDGNGKTITVSVPMFAYLDGATIKNLSTKGEINFRRDGKNIAYHCGSIAMEGEYLTLENVKSSTIIKGYDTGRAIRVPNPGSGVETVLYASAFAGGLLGSVYGDLSMKDCANFTNVTALCGSGLVGSLKKEQEDRGALTDQLTTYATFDNCHNYGTISDNDCEDLYAEEGNTLKLKVHGIHAGLLANGVMTEITFNACTNSGDILTTNSASETSFGGCSGGLSGYLERSDDLGNNLTANYIDCINSGTVIGPRRIGGIGGYTKGSVTALRCINDGDVTSRTNYAAGIVGRGGCDSYPNFVCDLIFEKCVNNGTITSHRQYAAGITGFSQDRIRVNYCLNTGDIYAEGVTKNSDNSAHNHYVNAAGMIARSQQSIELYYCVNLGNIISNSSAAGIAGRIGIGSLNGVSFTGGYNTFFGCFSGGDIVSYNEKQMYSIESVGPDDGYCHEMVPSLCSDDDDPEIGKDGICDSAHCGGRIGIDYHKNYYGGVSFVVGAAGIINFSYGSGNKQAPRIFGCGVTGNISSSHVGTACAFMTYANTDYAMIEGNYFTGELNGPDTCLIPHNVTLRDDYCLEYATTWINNCNAQKFIKNNYYLESIKSSGAMLLMNNGAEITWDGYDCFITQEDVRSGKLCYLVNKAAYDFIHVYPFLQKIGVDPYPMSPYYYLTYNGTVENVSVEQLHENIVVDYTYWVNVDASGNYVNELLIPEESIVATAPSTGNDTDDVSDDNVTTSDPTGGTTASPDVQTKDPNAGGNDDKKSGGCGSMVGTSLALAALTLMTPAVIVLRKKKDEE